MRKYVLFSGGFDSTLVLCKLAEASEDQTITTISIEPSFSGAKVERERKARKDIIELVKHRYPKVKIEESVLKIDIRDVQDTDTDELVQPLFWMPALMVCTKPDEDCEIWLGYICGDAAISKMDALKSMADAVSDFRLYKNMYLEFPLQYTTKSEVITQLYDIEPLLLNTCVTCENYSYINGKLCGECLPCKHLKSALVSIIVDDDIDEKLRKWCISVLENGFKLNVKYSTHSIEMKAKKKVNTKEKEN